MATNQTNLTGRTVYIVDGARTPFLKARGKPGPFLAADLGVNAGRPLLARQPFEPDALDEVITGCVMPGPTEANIARVVALRLECGDRVPAWTVQRNCASGLQALDCAAQNIATGRSDLVMAGGIEAMSHAPILFNDHLVNWLSDFSRARSAPARIKQLLKLRGKHLKPVIGLLCGLTDHVVGMSMGQTAEKLAFNYNISRSEMDTFAMESHKRLAAGQDEKHFGEIETMYDHNGKVYETDDGLRRDTDIASLSKLKPVFDRKFGKVTAGNSAQVTDGAAWMILASEEAVKKYQLDVKGRIVDAQWSALDPSQMGLGPAHAMAPIMNRGGFSINDIDYWEINEAFATQVLACLKVWTDNEYSRDQLGLGKALGDIPLERLNVDGGGISIGHPVGASGTRIVMHLMNILERTNAKRGMASLCIGGGQGGAMLVERA